MSVQDFIVSGRMLKNGFEFVIMAVIIALVVSSLINFVYAYEGEPKWGDNLIKKCVLYNSSYFYMRVSNATECEGIIKWYDTHNWKFVTETKGEIVLTFENNMTAKEKAFEEGKTENQ